MQVHCDSLKVRYINGSYANASSVVRGQGFVRWIQGLVRRGRVSSGGLWGMGSDVGLEDLWVQMLN